MIINDMIEADKSSENHCEQEMITVTIDRPIGSSHPDYPSIVYSLNYGYVEGIAAEDGQQQNAYVIGVDVPLDRFTGKKIAVIKRKECLGEKWVIAPENIPFTKQQIEEMIYFQEQYFDSSVEMLEDEMWDAYDENGQKLGYTVPRSMAKSLKDGEYHVIVMVYTVSENGRILVTQRSKNKTNPMKWEVTGGSILAGETPVCGAVRELKEETGIVRSKREMYEIYTCVDKKRHGIFHAFLNVTSEDTKIHLQMGETMNYQWLAYEDFEKLVLSDRFVGSEQERFIKNREKITALYSEVLRKNEVC
jgi:8-oxo-dGTP pyrophosphatase MutT (NUDIX family)/inorganic pyrophosphatase